MFQHRIETEIEISASPERVWTTLMAFTRYPEWNPFIRSIDGTPRAGARVVVQIEPAGKRGMTFRPTLTVVDEERELRWLGRLVMPGLFDGDHAFTLEPTSDGRTLFKQVESFRGVLVPLLKKSLDSNTRRGFDAMNQALKTRAETSA